MPMDREFWKKCIEFHGHECPGLASGFRAAETAAREIGVPFGRTEDEDIVCVTENDACGVDCIQFALSCTLGKGNMIMRLRGKHAWSFFNRKNGKSVRIVMKDFDRAGRSREEIIDFILNGPEEEVLDIKSPSFELPEKARIFRSIKCECCGEYAREDLIRFQDGCKVCLDCFKGYAPRW